MANPRATGRPRIVAVDSSACSHVVHCTICRASWVFLSLAEAEAVATEHRLIEQERALPRCSHPGCTDYGVRRGLCWSHARGREKRATK